MTSACGALVDAVPPKLKHSPGLHCVLAVQNSI